MNKAEEYAFYNNRPELEGIRVYWKEKIIKQPCESILRYFRLKALMEQIHGEIQPLIQKKRDLEDFLSNGYKSFAEYRDPSESNKGYVYFYSLLLKQDNTNLAAANEPVFDAVRVIETLRILNLQKENDEDD